MNLQTQTLLLFNERVDRLDRSELAKRMQDPHYEMDYDRMMKREWVSVDGVTEDAIDAFVLNIRLLLQERDGFSIKQLAEEVYSQPSVPVDLRDKFHTQRARWFECLEIPSVFGHFQDGRHFTTGELFDILLYGGLAHANRDKVGLFYALTKQGAVSSIICAWFLGTLNALLDIVRKIRDINKELLEYWKCQKINGLDEDSPGTDKLQRRR